MYINDRGYVMVWLPNRGNTRFHRYVMEQNLGRKLKNYEIVHHKNGDRLNNDIGNLELMTIKKHNKYHSKIRKPCKSRKPYSEWKFNKPKICQKKCIICKKTARCKGYCLLHYNQLPETKLRVRVYWQKLNSYAQKI